MVKFKATLTAHPIPHLRRRFHKHFEGCFVLELVEKSKTMFAIYSPSFHSFPSSVRFFLGFLTKMVMDKSQRKSSGVAFWGKIPYNKKTWTSLKHATALSSAYWSQNSIFWSHLHPLCVFLEQHILRYGERFVDEDLEEMMKNADLDRLVRNNAYFADTVKNSLKTSKLLRLYT